MLSPNGVLDRLKISRHPEGTERNPQSFCYCDALVNIPVLAGLICHRKISKHRHSERSEESHKYYEILRQTPQDDNRRHCLTRNRITSADSEENVPLAENRIPSPLGESDLRAEGLRRSRARISRASQDRVRGKKAAFTLSEVLITIGIIGVVAALVMGVIIPQIQDRQNIAKWKKEYSVISNAFQLVLNEGVQICEEYNQYGSCEMITSPIYHHFSQEFIDAMKSKLNIANWCTSMYGNYQNDNYCWNSLYYYRNNYNYWKNITKTKWIGIEGGHSTTSVYKPLGGTSLNSYNFSHYAILLNDGAVVYFGTLWGGPWVVVDVNNAQNGPNELGRDLFAIQVYSNIKTDTHWAKPLGAQGTQSWNDTTAGASGCSKDIGSQASNTIYQAAGAGCSAKYLGNY